MCKLTFVVDLLPYIDHNSQLTSRCHKQDFQSIRNNTTLKIINRIVIKWLKLVMTLTVIIPQQQA